MMQQEVMQVLVLAATVVVMTSGSCQYWCKTPPPLNAVYCCSLADRVYPEPQLRPGSCPPARKECPRSQIPEVCPHDGACPQKQKCCWDTCLELHTCKPIHQLPVELPSVPKVPVPPKAQEQKFPDVSQHARINTSAFNKTAKP
ncbi:uncharacterized protein [Procambarus clarkii]|uniref:uncharacterized protein n=1 Tax=Procambarus clarkii TaxID=6728 RepID=UPI001E671635|nr:uncharacterized protein LOC123768169 [Procambarus clarkii]